ncbi:MAG: SMC-Scp complex subunit ScpB [Fimbriimonadaceae bacterium]|nr:SMC-Scp complex subunit ScpB [Chitinophagales bacterium]
MNDLQKLIEALIFSAEQPISISELQTVLFTYSGEEISLEAIQEYADAIVLKYEGDDFIFEVVKSGGGYQFLTKPTYHKPISTLLQHRSRRKLSTAALECLSIIAYSQPITKTEVEQIRGVNCDHTIQKLLERDLIKITGRADTPGKPLQYGSTQYFMDYFGINNLDELPKLKEFEAKDISSIGDPGDIMVSVEETEAGTTIIANYDERREDAQNENYETNQEISSEDNDSEEQKEIPEGNS